MRFVVGNKIPPSTMSWLNDESGRVSVGADDAGVAPKHVLFIA
jgi:hypothetical protein